MRIYYGWFIVAISMSVLALVLGTTMISFGLFVLPVSEEFGLSRANVSTGVILANLGVAALAPFIGRMLDIYSIRTIMAVGAVLFGGSMIALGLSHNIWLSAFLLAVPLAIGIAASGTLSTMTLVARWFEVQRGRAMAFMAIGMSTGSVVMAPVVGMLIESVGWRNCLIVLGCAASVVFLLVIPFVREKPGANDVEPGSDDARAHAARSASAPTSATPLKVGELLRIPHFWMLVLSVALASGGAQSVTLAIVPIAQEAGVSVARSASLLSLIGGMAIVGKLVLAWIGDKLDKSLTLAMMFFLISIASVTLMFSESYPMLLASSAFLGLAAGGTLPMFLALLADRIGSASFGTANGIASLLMSLWGAIAIRFGGEVYDRTDSYDLMFATFAGIGVVAAFMTFISGKMAAPSGGVTKVSPQA